MRDRTADRASGKHDVAPEVMLLSTLHGLHARVPPYGFAELARIVTRVAPQILAVELTPAELAAREENQGKPEYSKAIFPLLDGLRARVVPLEPADPLRSDMLRPAEEEGMRMMSQNPAAVRAFGDFVRALFDYLCSSWISPAAVNSPQTDDLFRAKHDYQDVLFPEHAKLWQRWNEHFLQQVITTALGSPGQRLLALVGTEHSYWLRSRLAQDGRLRLLDAHAFLNALEAEHERA